MLSCRSWQQLATPQSQRPSCGSRICLIRPGSQQAHCYFSSAGAFRCRQRRRVGVRRVAVPHLPGLGSGRGYEGVRAHAVPRVRRGLCARALPLLPQAQRRHPPVQRLMKVQIPGEVALRALERLLCHEVSRRRCCGAAVSVQSLCRHSPVQRLNETHSSGLIWVGVAAPVPRMCPSVLQNITKHPPGHCRLVLRERCVFEQPGAVSKQVCQ